MSQLMTVPHALVFLEALCQAIAPLVENEKSQWICQQKHSLQNKYELEEQSRSQG